MTGIQVSREVLNFISEELASPGKMYLLDANITDYEDGLMGTTINGGFNIGEPGHWRYDYPFVHGGDSEVAISQLGYALFLESSLRGLFDNIPKMSLEELSEIVKDKRGGVYVSELSKRTSSSVKKECHGYLNIQSMRGDAVRNAGFVKAHGEIGNGEPFNRHKFDISFAVKF